MNMTDRKQISETIGEILNLGSPISDQQLEIFIRYFNRSYNSNYHIENLDMTFYNLFLKYVNTRAIRCAFYFYCFIFIILIIFLVIFTTIKLS